MIYIFRLTGQSEAERLLILIQNLLDISPDELRQRRLLSERVFEAVAWIHLDSNGFQLIAMHSN